MENPFRLFGAKGSGSVPIEAALTLLDLPYQITEIAPWEGAAARDAIGAVNPLRQIPALLLPSGELMTESAAMLIWLADRHPDAGLAPLPPDALRPAFLRWMTFVSSAIYGLYWVRDDPSRLADDPAHQALVRERTLGRIIDCWAMMEAQIEPGAYVLGERLSVLDLYVAVVSRWGPRRKRFYAAAPRLGVVVRRVDAEPRLANLWAERFPFTGAWEG